MNMLRTLVLGIVLGATACTQPLVARDTAEDIDLEQSLYAQRWMEAFRRLDATNNITMVLSNRDSLYELEHVVEIEAHSRFLVVRCMPPGGRSYRAIVYPATILLIKETPENAGAADRG